MDIKGLLRKLANGYHYGYPECCVVQFIEDEIFRGAGQDNDTRKFEPLKYREQMGIDYVPCDSCIDDWIGRESISTIVEQLIKVNELALARQLPPLPLNLDVVELAKDRWKMVEILSAVNAVITGLTIAPDEDVDEIYAETTKLFRHPELNRTGEASSVRLLRLKRLQYDYKVWPLEIDWNAVDGLKALGFTGEPDEETHHKLPDEKGVDDQPGALGEAHPPLSELVK